MKPWFPVFVRRVDVPANNESIRNKVMDDHPSYMCNGKVFYDLFFDPYTLAVLMSMETCVGRDSRCRASIEDLTMMLGSQSRRLMTETRNSIQKIVDAAEDVPAGRFVPNKDVSSINTNSMIVFKRSSTYFADGKVAPKYKDKIGFNVRDKTKISYLMIPNELIEQILYGKALKHAEKALWVAVYLLLVMRIEGTKNAREAAVITRDKVSKATGVAPNTVDNVVRAMIECGVMVKRDLFIRLDNGGRFIARYTVIARTEYALDQKWNSLYAEKIAYYSGDAIVSGGRKRQDEI